MNDPNPEGNNSVGIDLLGLIRDNGRRAATVSAIVAGIVAVAGLVYLKIQPRQQVAMLEFRPTFSGAERGQYPNGLAFSPTDVTASSVLDSVFEGNQLKAYCTSQEFRGGFFVEQYSDQGLFLDMEYRARLSEPRLDIVERQELQDAHTAKKNALPLQFRLVFTPKACGGIPKAALSKTMVEVLSTWATESESKRGVLTQRAEVLTPTVLDVPVGGAGGAVLRADLLKTALNRIIGNIESVSELPGAILVRTGGRHTFMEIRGKLADLVTSRLDPLVMTSGRSMVSESAVWVNETVAMAERQQRAAEKRSAAYQGALREFSGVSSTPGANRASSALIPNAGNGQTLVPQIDGTFIDRIVEMSQANARYRQELTALMVEAQIEAVASEERANYYRRLLQVPRSTAGDVSSKELETKLDEIAAEGKVLTTQFNDLFDEFSRVALRPAGSMYQTEKPVEISVNQAYSMRSVGFATVGAFLATLLLMLGFVLVRDRLALEAH